MVLLGLIGCTGSGRSTATQFLIKNRKFVNLSYGMLYTNHFKNFASKINIYEPINNNFDRILAEIMYDRVKSIEGNVVISNCRLTELMLVNNLGGYTVRIIRGKKKEYLDFEEIPIITDYTISNNGDIGDLYMNLDVVLTDIVDKTDGMIKKDKIYNF